MSQWQQWSEKFFELSQREKVIVAGAAIFLVTYGLFFVLIKPALDQQKKLEVLTLNAQNQVEQTREQINEIQAALRIDPNEALKSEINRLKAELAIVEADLAEVMDDYVAPDKMVKELTRLLETQEQIRVTGVAALPPSRIKGNYEASESNVKLPELYSHKFEIIVEGEYFPLMGFVKTIVARNKEFSVNDLNYEVTEHPKAKLTLTLVTISDSKNVIRL